MISFLLLLLIVNVYSSPLIEEFSWSRIDYAWPSDGEARPGGPAGGGAGGFVFPMHQNGYHRKSGSSSSQRQGAGFINTIRNEYQFENNIPMGANGWGNKLFITVPRRRNGVPSTLNFVWMNETDRHDTPLIPYPDWESNQVQPVTADQDFNLVSVYRVGIDACDRMWMVDTGRIEIPNNPNQVQPPSIVIIDLRTNRLIRKYVFKDEDIRPASTLASITIDVTKSTCDRAFAYIPDLSGYGLVVYSFQENDSWRVSHNYFYLETLAGEFHIGGFDFQWNDGIFSVALTNPGPDGFRKAYFHSMAGSHIYSVSTRILRDRALATRSYHGDDFKVEVDRPIGTQTSASDMHKDTGILFLALVNQNALGCWNTKRGPAKQNFDVVHKHDQEFIYPSDVKVHNDKVMVLTNTMPVFLYGRLNYNEKNFRVWMQRVNEAVKGTRCA